MTTYFSTYISGFGEIIEDLLKRKLSDVQIKTNLDGLIIFDSNDPFFAIKNLRFLNNSFVLLDKNLNKIDRQILSGFKSFRIVYSKENEFTKLDTAALKKIESLIFKTLHLKVSRDNPETEFWILKRSEGLKLFGLRITKRESNLEKGKLRPELANILCELSDPTSADVFLDPFAGSGAIVFERTNMAKFQKIFAGENNKNVYQVLINKTKRLNVPIIVGKWNATKLGALSDQSVNKIVTDPPWGQYDNTINIEELYNKAMLEFYRILKVNGILVILTAQKDLITELLNNYDGKLLLERQFNILVSGKKAGVFKIIKIN